MKKYTERTYKRLKYKKYSDHIEISKCSRSAKKVVIPAEIKRLPVTSIGYLAFWGCSSLTEITIPDSVTSISGSAFSFCSSLTEITIPDSVTSIGWCIFKKCSDLTSIDVSENNNNYMSEDGVLFDKNKTALIAYPTGKKNTEYIIPDGVTSIGEHAFYYCSSLKEITIPNSVTSISWGAFHNCSDLTSIDVSENNNNYMSEDGVLFDKNKTALIAYPTGKKNTEYIIPDSVKSIGDFAFYKCSSLTSITIPDSVESIGSSAFYYCSSLTSVTIPYGVTSIGERAFYECSSLTSATIPDSVTNIGRGAFWGCSSLTNVTIPASVTSIGSFAFEFCKSLTEITIPDSVTSIGESAFSDCKSLTDITISDGVTSIGHGAFSYCSSLKKIVIENPECEIDDDESTISNYFNNKHYFNGTIYGYANSTAQKYAEKYEREFVSLGEAPLR